MALVPPGTVPKTPSGKTRRRACRDAYVDGSLDAVAVIALGSKPADAPGPDAPLTPGEELMVGIWSEVLGVGAADVGVDDGFFELGGDSLAAELAGAPAVLELPADRPRPAVRTYDGARYRFDVPEPVALRLVALGRAEGATLFMTLLAALKALLHVHSGQTDIVVGAYAANRQPPETAALIGLFANPIAVRTRLDARLGFRELLRRVRRAALAASAHQDAPFQRVVERLGLPARRDVTPVYQVMLVMQDLSPYRAADLAAVSARPLREDWVEWDAELAPCDLELHMAQGADGGLLGDLCYSTDLFERLRAADLVSHFQRILEAVAADPERRLERLRR